MKTKKQLKIIAIVRSKELRNKIAGYITSIVNRNLAQQNASIGYSEDVVESREESKE